MMTSPLSILISIVLIFGLAYVLVIVFAALRKMTHEKQIDQSAE
jgi:hypothetical protein